MKNRITAWAPDRTAMLSLVMVAGSVLVFLPGGLFRFSWAKVLVLLLALGVGLWTPRSGRLPHSANLALGLGAVALVLAALFSADPEGSFLGRWPRYEGVLVLGIYAGVLALGAKLLGGAQQGARWSTLYRSLAVASLILALVSSLESLGLRPLGGIADLRPGATLGNASDQGLVGMMLAVVLALPSLRDGGSKWLLRGGVAAAVLTTVLSGSRAALLGLVLAIITAVLMDLAVNKRQPRLTVGAGMGALLVVGALVLAIPETRDRLLASGTVSGRWLLWQLSLNMVKDHPWTGVGPSGFVDAFPRYQTLEWAVEAGGDFPADSPHMWPLQALLVGGIPLLLIAVVVAASVIGIAVLRIRAAAETEHRINLIGAFAALTGYGTGLMAGFTSPGTTPLAALLCGALIGTALPPSPPRLRWAPLSAWRNRPAAVIASTVAVCAGLILAVPAAAAEWPMAAGARSARDGNLPQADREFKTAYALRPWDSDTALLAAQAFAGPATSGNKEAAAHTIEWAKISLAKTPDSVEAGLALSIGYINSGDLSTAKQQLDRLISRAPYTTGLYVQRGIANFGLGRPDQSIADLRTAASQSPFSPEPWQIMARIYERLGLLDQAKTAQARANALL